MGFHGITRARACCAALSVLMVLLLSPRAEAAPTLQLDPAVLAIGTTPHLQLTPMTLAAADDMDFDLLGEAKPVVRSAADLELERKSGVRRSMLNVHQIAGFSTLGLLAVSAVIGQLQYLDRFAGDAPAQTNKWRLPHQIATGATTVGFATTGLLGLLAPVPFEKPSGQVDTVTFHKSFMAGATLGMLTEIGLGIYTASRPGFANQKSLAQVHQIIGFSTLGLMSLGLGSLAF